MTANRPRVKISRPRAGWGIEPEVIITVTSGFGDKLTLSARGDSIRASLKGEGGLGSLPSVMLYGQMDVDNQTDG